MRACPTCKRRYPPGINFCPEDGTPLDDRDPLLGTVLLGQFELRRICGTGSMGTVYRAWQGTMERHVAIKILRRDLQDDAHIAKRFLREARAAARLSHANIITVYMVGEADDGRPFIVMEYVSGESLDDLSRDAGPLPPVRALHIIRQITSALVEAHAHDIVHRDLKPANILVTQRRTSPDAVKVVDFGIAKILHEGDETQLTQTGAIFGTPYYLSPEQASGSELDPRCDIYSLGVILFRLLCGRLPFESDSGMEVLIQHLKQAPPRPRDIEPSIPSKVEALVLKALEKDREERWSSAEELLRAIDALAAELYGGAAELPALSAAAHQAAGRHEDALEPQAKVAETAPAASPLARRISAAAARAEAHRAARSREESAQPPQREDALAKRKTETSPQDLRDDAGAAGDSVADLPATRPHDITPRGAATRPAETPISSLAVHEAVEETLRRRRVSEGSAALLRADTDFLAAHMHRRKRVLKHVLLACLSAILGAGLGAAFHIYKRSQAPIMLQAAQEGSAAPAPEVKPPPSPAAKAGPTAADAGSGPGSAKARPAWARKPPAKGKRGKRPRGAKKRRGKRGTPARKKAVPKTVPKTKKAPAGDPPIVDPVPIKPLPVPKAKVGEPATTGDGSDHGSDHTPQKPKKPKKPKKKPYDTLYDLVD